MQDKLAVLIVYAALGIALGLWPTLALVWPKGDDLTFPKLRGSWLAGAAMAISVAGIAAQGLQVSAMAAVVLLGWFFIDRRAEKQLQRLAGCALALAIMPVLIWWRRGVGIHVDLSWTEAAMASAIALGSLWIFSQRTRDATNADPVALQIGDAVAFALFGAITLYLAFSTGIYAEPAVFLTAWHHWSAYVGPAEQLWSGARVFYDVPLQYGLGPSAAIAALCSANCWIGMYAISGLATAGLCALVGVLAFNLAERVELTRPARWLILAISILCCFFWTSLPLSTSSPVITPSTSGLRFLPALLLVSFLVWRYGAAGSTRYLAGHIAWAAACLWSPESSFYVTFVWWPFYLWARCSAATRQDVLKGALQSVGVLILALTALVLLFNAIYWLIYGVLPNFYAYWAYAIDPPGAMAINPVGSIWYFVGVLIAGVASLVAIFRSEGDGPAFRRQFLLLLVAYAVFSYFLGRSHDNNVLNLMPFMLLVVLAAMSGPLSSFWSSLTKTLFVAMLTWICLFGWTAWNEAFRQGRGFEFAPTRVIASFSYADPRTARLVGERVSIARPDDAARAIAYIERKYGEPVTVLDSNISLVVTPKPKVWSAIYDPANLYFFHGDKRQEFLIAAARRFGRRGWLVVDRAFPAGLWLVDIERAYDRVESRDFGSYYAIRYSPKPSVR